MELTANAVISVKGLDDLNTKLEEAGDKLVIIDFYATWCGPCRMIAPQIEELCKTVDDVYFLKVDVDENEDIVSEYDISSMPTFVYIKNKEKLDTFSGNDFERLKQLLETHK